MFYACLIVCLGFFLFCVVHITKEYSLNKFSSLSLFRGHMDSHSNDYITPKVCLSDHSAKPDSVYLYIFSNYVM